MSDVDRADASVPIIELPKSVCVCVCVCVSSVHVHWVSLLVTYVELPVTLWSGVSVLSAVIGTQGELYDYRSCLSLCLVLSTGSISKGSRNGSKRLFSLHKMHHDVYTRFQCSYKTTNYV